MRDCTAATGSNGRGQRGEPVTSVLIVVSSSNPYLLPQDLIYGRALLQHVFRDDFRPLLLHVQHESVQRLLYVTDGIFAAIIVAVAGGVIGASAVITAAVVIIVVAGIVAAGVVVVVVLMILVHMIQAVIVHIN